MVTAAMQLGRYVLGPRIAQGGMGEVYLATQTGMGAFAKPLVLKLMLPHLAKSQRAIDMFLAEARLASRMNHPNVVQLFDVGLIDGRYFLAMELVRGVSLAKLVAALRATGQQLPEHVLLYVARCLCDGLHHAHEQRDPDGNPLNLVHQDVTLENVLVGTDGQVKLTDFGIARAQREQGADFTGGKRGYIAPEGLRGEQLDRRADVYGAAVTLLSLAATERPDERNGEALPSTALTQLSEPTLRALERAASPERAARFESARRFRDALPPVDSSDAAEELGQLVQRVCAQQLNQLDDNVQRTTAFSKGGTAAVSVVVPTHDDRGQRSSTTRRALGVVAALAVMLVGGWQLVQQRPVVSVIEDAGSPAATLAAFDAGAAIVEVVVLDAGSATEPRVDAGAALMATVRPRPVGVRPPVPVQPPQPAPAATGVLIIDAVPWAMVSVNGAAPVETPIARLVVPAGPATVDFDNPELGIKRRRTVQVPPNGALTVTENLR